MKPVVIGDDPWELAQWGLGTRYAPPRRRMLTDRLGLLLAALVGEPRVATSAAVSRVSRRSVFEALAARIFLWAVLMVFYFILFYSFFWTVLLFFFFVFVSPLPLPLFPPLPPQVLREASYLFTFHSVYFPSLSVSPSPFLCMPLSPSFSYSPF